MSPHQPVLHRSEKRTQRALLFLIVLLCALALGLPGRARAQVVPCGSDGQRACCFGETDFGPCRPGNSEVASPRSGLCGGFNPWGTQSSGVCVADTPCGGDGQRACCAGEEAFGACRPGFVEVPLRNAGQCSRSLPGIQSSGVCVADTPCGGEGQRACCAGERSFGACLSGLSEVPQANAGQCSNALPGERSGGVCMAGTPCGGKGQRACCAGERSFGACQAGLIEVPRANSGQCSNAAPGVQSGGTCADLPCGGEGERACVPQQRSTACNPHLAERGGLCTLQNNSLPRRDNIGFPVRGAVRWSVLLCHYRDQAVESWKTPEYYQRLLQQRGTNGLPDYLDEVSRGLFTQEMKVSGWYVVDQPFAERRNEAQLDDCMQAARAAGFAPPPEDLVMVLPPSDMGARPNVGQRVLVPPVLDGMLHEMLHVYGLVDNLSHVVVDYGDPRAVRLAPGPASYGDPFDIMSWELSYYGRATPFGGSDGPRLNGFTLDRFGWLGVDEATTFGALGETSATYTLAPLYAPGRGGTRIVRVPFDAGDPRHYYQIELRDANGRDAGFGRPVVLLYEIKRHPDGTQSATSGGPPESYLLRDGTGGPATQSISANGVTISVGPIAADGTAQVSVRSDFARRCLPGSVWRVAGPDDLVCVDGAARDRVALENKQAGSFRQPGGGAFGPDTCRQGYVWRHAFADDRVCVTGRARDAAAAENRDAAARTNPARLTTGPNLCRDGFVWRLIDPYDYVCVPPANRDEAQADNRLDTTRRTSRFRGDCSAPFVPRRAFPGDRICVTPQASLKARVDSSLAWERNFGRLR